MSELRFLGILAVTMIIWTFVVPEFADDVKRLEAWVARKVMRASGEHADPRETGPLNELPHHPRYGALLNDTPPDGTPAVVQGHALTVGKHEHTVPRADAPHLAPDVFERFRHVLADNGIMPGDLPRREPLRTLFAPAQAPADPSPSMLPLTGPIPRVPVHGEKPQLAVEQAQRLAGEMIP